MSVQFFISVWCIHLFPQLNFLYIYLEEQHLARNAADWKILWILLKLYPFRLNVFTKNDLANEQSLAWTSLLHDEVNNLMFFVLLIRNNYPPKLKDKLNMHLLPQEGPSLKSKGKASSGMRTLVLTWRSLLIMSREWKYYWLRLILYMLLTLCIGTVFSGLGHSLSSVVVSLFLLRTYYYIWNFVGKKVNAKYWLLILVDLTEVVIIIC